MRKILLLLCVFSAKIIFSQTPNAAYDSTLAKALGGDDAGMRSYIMAVLKTGPRDTLVTEKNVRDSIFAGHMENIGRLAEDKSLVVAGPFGKNDKTYRGIFIFTVATIDEAKMLVATDPAVRAGIFEVEYFNWYCTAALMEIPVIHNRITKYVE